MCLRGPLYFADDILPWWVTYFLSKYNAPRTVIFSRKHFSSQEMGIDSKMCPYVPSSPAHFSLETSAGMPGGSLGLGGKRRRPGTAIPFRTGRQCSVCPWQTSPPIKGYPIFSSDPGNQGCSGCSHSRFGLAAPSHSPNFLSAWRCLEHWG